MKKHVKVYLKHFGYGEQDVILDELGDGVAVDIHHIIFKSKGGKDVIGNLIALSRKNHDIAHGKIEGEHLFKEYLLSFVMLRDAEWDERNQTPQGVR